MTAIVERDQEGNATLRPRNEVVSADATSIMAVIDRAARDPSVNIDKLERMMAMYERVTDRTAKAAYSDALSQMQPELPVIAERGKIDLGRGKPQSYALWEDINEAIKPVLAKHGFAVSFRTGREDGMIVVTGILSHRDGHSEETTMHLPIDASGSKNAVQAVGSSTSYGKRYTASALLNLTSRLSEDKDDDGRAAGAAGPITDEQADEIAKLITATKSDIGKFLAFMKVESISDIPAAQFDKAIGPLRTKASKP
jgi:hypothetical protein